MNNSSKNHYEVLGVSSDASDEEIKQAFHEFAKNNHPDRNPDNSESEHLFKRAVLAYETLKDPLLRQAFDEMIAFDRRKRYSGRRQGHRLLMIFALLLITPSAIFLSLFVSGDKAFLSNLGFLPKTIGGFETGFGNTNTVTGYGVTSSTGPENTSAISKETTSGERRTANLSPKPIDKAANAAAPRTSLPETIGPIGVETASRSVAVPPDAYGIQNQDTPAPETAQSPMPENRIAALKPPAPEIVLSANVDISGPFSDCNICPLMFIPKRSIAGLVGANRAISMSEITIAQWETCTNDGACPQYDKGTARTSEPVRGIAKEAADIYAEWLAGVTGQRYSAVIPTEQAECDANAKRSSSNRWDWMKAPSGQDCATVGGFRVSRQTEPGS
ncbi:MAG: DnaJ domain-containing protein [Hyphomicrobiales bacterium]|nr:DnaJ domain-containing protein [Hyphomicrobiales bacterium]